MAQKKKSKESKRQTGADILKMLKGNKTMTTRQVFTSLNKQRPITIHTIRACVRRLIDNKKLVVVKNEKRMFVLRAAAKKK